MLLIDNHFSYLLIAKKKPLLSQRLF